MKHIAVLTSGGDAPGMNAAIRAVTRSALDEGMTVFGVLQGWQGLVDGQFRQLSARDVGGIIQVGGTFLGSARSAEFPEESGRSKALHNLAQRGIDGGVAISQRSVRQGLIREQIEDGLAVVKAVGKSGVKLPPPFDEFFGRFGRRKVIFLADEIHHCARVLDLDAAERIVEQQIVIELE
jgi:hypothetical protein